MQALKVMSRVKKFSKNVQGQDLNSHHLWFLVQKSVALPTAKPYTVEWLFSLHQYPLHTCMHEQQHVLLKIYLVIPEDSPFISSKSGFNSCRHDCDIGMTIRQTAFQLYIQTSKYTCPIVQVHACPYLPRLLHLLRLPTLLYLLSFCLSSLLRLFSVLADGAYTCLPRLLHALSLPSLLYLIFAWLIFCTYLVYFPMAIAIRIVSYVCLLLSLMCLQCYYNWYGYVVAQSVRAKPYADGCFGLYQCLLHTSMDE